MVDVAYNKTNNRNKRHIWPIVYLQCVRPCLSQARRAPALLLTYLPTLIVTTRLYTPTAPLMWRHMSCHGYHGELQTLLKKTTKLKVSIFFFFSFIAPRALGRV